jgi:tetratricopeptide (TPR) repeat protein
LRSQEEIVIMGFWNTLFGGTEPSPEEEKRKQVQKDFDLLKYDGVKALKMGQTAYAVRCFTEALKLQDDLEIHDYLSQALLRENDLKGAMEQLLQLREAAPENVELLLRMVQVSFMEEDYKEMERFCMEVMRMAPENAQAYFFLAKAKLGQSSPIEAVAMLTKAIALEDNYADAYLLRGQILLSMGDLTGAQVDVAWLTEHVGDQEDVLLLEARVLVLKGDNQKALDIYNKVIGVNPFLAEAYRERGQLYFEAGNKTAAEEDMQKVLELDPQQMADVNGEFSAEGIEEKVKRAYSYLNPLGL